MIMQGMIRIAMITFHGNSSWLFSTSFLAYHSLLQSKWCLGTIWGRLFFSSSFFSAIVVFHINRFLDLLTAFSWWRTHYMQLVYVTCQGELVFTRQGPRLTWKMQDVGEPDLFFRNLLGELVICEHTKIHPHDNVVSYGFGFS